MQLYYYPLPIKKLKKNIFFIFYFFFKIEKNELPIADPSEQFKKLSELNNLVVTQLNSIDLSIQKFILRFEPQSNNLTNLNNRIHAQERIYNNIFSLKDQLNEIYQKLSTSQRLKSILDSKIDDSFDKYINSIDEIIVTRDILSKYSFSDAKNEIKELENIKISSIAQINIYFCSCIDKASTQFDLNIFKINNEKIEIIDQNYIQNKFYPLSNDLLSRINRMASILKRVGGEDHKRVFIEVRRNNFLKSIRPLINQCKNRLLLSGPSNATDLPTYQKVQVQLIY